MRFQSSHFSKKYVVILCVLLVLVIYLASGVGLARKGSVAPLLDLTSCRAELQGFVALESKKTAVFINWTQMHSRPEVAKLSQDYGLTDNMRFFMLVYESGLWGHAGSGSGSSLKQSEKSVCLIAHLVRVLGCTLVLDLPAGDQTWAQHLRRLLPEIKYVGVDLVPGVVQFARDNFGHGAPSRAEFFLGDMAQDRHLIAKIRKQSRLWTQDDRVLLISRHIFFHLPYSNILSFLLQVTDTPYVDYFLTTNGGEVKENPPLDAPFKAGGWRAVNLKKIPFPDDWSQIAPIVSWVEDDFMGTNWMELYDQKKLPGRQHYGKYDLTLPLQFECNQGKLVSFCGQKERPSICSVCDNRTSAPVS